MQMLRHSNDKSQFNNILEMKFFLLLCLYCGSLVMSIYLFSIFQGNCKNSFKLANKQCEIVLTLTLGDFISVKEYTDDVIVVLKQIYFN